MTSISLEYTFERNSQDYACEKTIVQDLICKLLFLSRVKYCININYTILVTCEFIKDLLNHND